MKRIIILSLGMILIICSSVYGRNPDVKWIGDIAITPAAPMEGNSVKIEGTFRATWAAVDNLKITGGIDGTTIYNRTFPHVDQGVNTNVFFNWTATSGRHNAWFKIDPDNTIGDADVTNNNINKDFTVSIKITKMPEKIIITKPPQIAKPDLIIQSIEVIPPTPHITDNVTARVIVKNIGSSKSDAGGGGLVILVKKKADNSTIKDVLTAIPELAPNGTFEYYVKEGKWFETSGIGWYSVWAYADWLNHIIESNETNNAKTIELSVLP